METDERKVGYFESAHNVRVNLSNEMNKNNEDKEWFRVSTQWARNLWFTRSRDSIRYENLFIPSLEKDMIAQYAQLPSECKSFLPCVDKIRRCYVDLPY